MLTYPYIVQFTMFYFVVHRQRDNGGQPPPLHWRPQRDRHWQGAH